MTVYILEGNECNFKTTVAEKLSKQMSIPVVKGSSFELSQCSNEALFEHFKQMAQLDNVIIDRFIYSNRVYATLYEDFAILTDGQRKEIEDILKGKTTVAYLFADGEVIKERISERGDDYVDVSMVEKINYTYIGTMLDSTLKVVSYDTEEWNSSAIAEDLADRYEQND